MKSLLNTLIVVGLVSVLSGARASSVLPISAPELVRVSDAIFRGTVVGASCYRDTNGLIYTRTSLRVDESLKGIFPAIVQVTHRGGRIGNEDEFYGLSPRFTSGAEYLLFVVRDWYGRLQCAQGQASAVPLNTSKPYSDPLLAEVRQLTRNGQLPGADVTDQAGQAGATPDALSGMLGGIASRFIQPDRGEPIPYLVDADSLPNGITLTQATNAIQQALNAWVAVTSLKFRFDGFQSFGQGADTIIADDGKLRIQLHDNYNSITGPNILGIGGRDGSSSTFAGLSWDIGGNVAGNEFWRSSRGFVVLKTSNSAMETLATLTEVLCHEIGHSLNLAHSSEDPSEANPVLKGAIMYFQAHEDGRGATLGSYDPPIIQQIYPFNSPPFFVHSFNRFMDITTASTVPSVTGINEIDFSRFDLQGNATLVLTNVTGGNGTFSTPGSLLRYTPSPGAFNAIRLDPAGNSAYDRLTARVTDGTNSSPWVTVRVLSFNADSVAPSDGIPDSWMISYFGNANPAVGSNHRATNDFDGDTISNLDEYRAGMAPTNNNLAQRITTFTGSTISWQAKVYELYDIQSSTDLKTWNVFMTVMPTNAPIQVRTNLLATNIIATVSNLSTSSAQTFYRVQKVP